MNKIKTYRILALITLVIYLATNINAENNIALISPAKLNNNLINQLDLTKNLTPEQKKKFYGDTFYGNYQEDEELIFKGLKLEDTEKKEILNVLPKPLPGKLVGERKDLDINGKGYLLDYLDPWKDIETKNDKIELAFDNVDLNQFIKYISDLFKVTFITADNLDPVPEGWKKLEGNKITFKSHKPLTEEQVWEIALAFLEMAGFSIVPEATLEKTYLIVPSAASKGYSANKEPLPTFIGVEPESLPNNDSKIRYVYFVKNADLKSIAEILKKMVSTSASDPIIFQDIRAIILTDTASNIRSIMNIVTELDKVSRPEVLSVMRLNRANAESVANLINKELLPQRDDNQVFWGQPARKAPTTSYFSKRLRVVAYPTTNSLIILGPEKAVRRLEEFVSSEIDQETPLPYAPLHIYKLKHLNATNVATMLNNLVQFGAETPAGKVGGVRGEDQYFGRDVAVFAENSRNSLIIKAGYEDYLKIKQTLDRIDVEQPQVALKVLILNVDLENAKQLGTQLRSKTSACNNGIFNNIAFQNSNLGRFIERPNTATTTSDTNGALRLLGNLVSLAIGQQAGSTLISLGSDLCGVWGLLKVLDNYTRTSIIANPFLVTTNKYPAKIVVGETRRVAQATVQGNTTTQSFEDDSANLTVEINPTISYDDMVNLEIFVELDNFIDPTNPTSGNKITRGIQTTALVADKEVIALGGLAITRAEETLRKIPVLGDIPLLGVFAKFKSKRILKRHLLILVSPQVIRPDEPEEAAYLTNTKINSVKETIFEGKDPAEFRDPIFRWFFEDYKDEEASEIDKFVGRQSRYDINKTARALAPTRVLAQNNNDKLKSKKNSSLLDFIKEKDTENKEVAI